MASAGGQSEGTQEGNQSVEGLAAVAHNVFLGAADFSEGLFQGHVEKYRVIAEAASAPRRGENLPFDKVREQRDELLPLPQRQNTDEARAAEAFGEVFHGFEQFPNAVGVARACPGIASGTN